MLFSDAYLKLLKYEVFLGFFFPLILSLLKIISPILSEFVHKQYQCVVKSLKDK